MAVSSVVALLALGPLLPVIFLLFMRLALRGLGWFLEEKTKERRAAIAARIARERAAVHERQEISREVEDGWQNIEKTGTAENGKSPQDEFNGVVGFFHPFCNAGGGGERVLWAAIAATQRRWPNAICAVYTGDHDIDRSVVVATVRDRFGITLQEHSLLFLYLSRRHFVLASTYPHFTLLGQSLGSLILAYDAFQLLVPDIFVDTMGYAFAVAFCTYLFPRVRTAAYVHYPTISIDMLDSLDDTTGQRGIHSGAGAGWKGKLKRYYWTAFAWLYGWVGSQIDVVMCNSTWTQGHIRQLWKPKKTSSKARFAAVVYPPCPVEELESKIRVTEESEKRRENIVLYIAQFRPEKNHSLILRAFAQYYHAARDKPRLVLIGSVRSNTPDEKHIYNLRLEARELKVKDATAFICDAPFSVILDYLQKSSITTNGMYSEHFGIGNVEGLAAGLIPVVHNSGGPKLDIVVPYEGQPIGFLAETDEEFAAGYQRVAAMSPQERFAMRLRGRKSAFRFTEESFASKWIENMETLVNMQTP
ncbi:asparagine-linked glycosylation protein [Exophiala dermatitidis]|uniref:GDP-Man:Man(3)GlcNAc(2)-PP-Dol alpha-1,2-mannosyltransferase n=2 Tax=Exophiala dermatitidis TaxID=5970 RepID=H6BUH2_EXODN|nr:alpha-1,2-mannosyltransferase [Exophiala dermatitidis NIH/UT8656]KAJ4506556.1 asparagine-linked glycosylation protein [Exophiala dermatitidis]EHY55714.1 alpha-1,2-mannosyltransferase [Exophiala dermatitidis NIH/UT8656]KAJ4508823.1 asparagine-linked glycosylation protein [Exophiala dermatitidis]KAJ4510075.1 asparagine-linked glycosylation protein [Exophiala dermatitidis]KAJ4539078.1 asparagine-linked glycosylation protein [Exophiala dermatitidis]